MLQSCPLAPPFEHLRNRMALFSAVDIEASHFRLLHFINSSINRRFSVSCTHCWFPTTAIKLLLTHTLPPIEALQLCLKWRSVARLASAFSALAPLPVTNVIQPSVLQPLITSKRLQQQRLEWRDPTTPTHTGHSGVFEIAELHPRRLGGHDEGLIFLTPRKNNENLPCLVWQGSSLGIVESCLRSWNAWAALEFGLHEGVGSAPTLFHLPLVTSLRPWVLCISTATGLRSSTLTLALSFNNGSRSFEVLGPLPRLRASKPLCWLPVPELLLVDNASSAF